MAAALLRGRSRIPTCMDSALICTQGDGTAQPEVFVRLADSYLQSEVTVEFFPGPSAGLGREPGARGDPRRGPRGPLTTCGGGLSGDGHAAAAPPAPSGAGPSSPPQPGSGGQEETGSPGAARHSPAHLSNSTALRNPFPVTHRAGAGAARTASAASGCGCGHLCLHRVLGSGFD